MNKNFRFFAILEVFRFFSKFSERVVTLPIGVEIRFHEIPNCLFLFITVKFWVEIKFSFEMIEKIENCSCLETERELFKLNCGSRTFNSPVRYLIN